MKKGIFSVVILFCCTILFFGCIKNTPNTPTIDPSMTASIGSYHFTAASVIPAQLDTQRHDTSTTLYITGNSSDPNFPYDKLVMTVTNYRGLTGVFSIVKNEANAAYWHAGVPDGALGGIVAITKVTSNTIIGYFNFNTVNGLNITNGTFTVGKP